MNPQMVLDQTRRELRDFLIGEPDASDSAEAEKLSDGGRPNVRGSSHSSERRRSTTAKKNVNRIDWMGLVKAGASSWWRDHPLHIGASVLKPVVSDYVRRKPVATLALSAAVGAAFVFIRPWRIASVAALGMSLVRSSNLPVMAASLVATVAENLQKEQS